jgi:hypothetical protein
MGTDPFSESLCELSVAEILVLKEASWGQQKFFITYIMNPCLSKQNV